MPRPLRMTVAAVALMAMLVSGVAICPCAAASPDSDAGHACCRTTAWNAADSGCCGASTDAVPEADLPSTATDALGVLPVPVGPVGRGAVPVAIVGAAVEAAAVPPPAPVLRI